MEAAVVSRRASSMRYFIAYLIVIEINDRRSISWNCVHWRLETRKHSMIGMRKFSLIIYWFWFPLLDTWLSSFLLESSMWSVQRNWWRIILNLLRNLTWTILIWMQWGKTSWNNFLSLICWSWPTNLKKGISRELDTLSGYLEQEIDRTECVLKILFSIFSMCMKNFLYERL